MLASGYPEDSWVQVNLTPGSGALPGLYGQIADTAHELLGSSAEAFFFMHKPPGLRVRFQAHDEDGAASLRVEVRERCAKFDGLAAAPVCVVYEPESYLFGGERAMPFVHELFTVDSLAWLDAHSGRLSGGGPPLAPWRMSLFLLNELLTGLGIVGWEHRGVWQTLRNETGRALAEGLSDDSLRQAAEGIRTCWTAPLSHQLAELPSAGRAALEGHGAAARRVAERWRAGYFESGQAVRGPRRAVAHAVVFHWNRARLSAARQRLITEALLAEEEH